MVKADCSAELRHGFAEAIKAKYTNNIDTIANLFISYLSMHNLDLKS
jgi:hypothetical protein